MKKMHIPYWHPIRGMFTADYAFHTFPESVMECFIIRFACQFLIASKVALISDLSLKEFKSSLPGQSTVPHPLPRMGNQGRTEASLALGYI
jgi:hypothetical protein